MRLFFAKDQPRAFAIRYEFRRRITRKVYFGRMAFSPFLRSNPIERSSVGSLSLDAAGEFAECLVADLPHALALQSHALAGHGHGASLAVKAVEEQDDPALAVVETGEPLKQLLAHHATVEASVDGDGVGILDDGMEREGAIAADRDRLVEGKRTRSGPLATPCGLARGVLQDVLLFDGPLHGLTDEGGGEDHEANAPRTVKLGRGVHQGDIALAHEVVLVQSVPPIVVGQGDDKPQVGLRQLFERARVAYLDAVGQLALLLIAQKLLLGNVVYVLLIDCHKKISFAARGEASPPRARCCTWILRLRLLGTSDEPFGHKPNDGHGHQGEDDELDVVAIFHDLALQLVGRDDRGEIPAEERQDGVPGACADGGIEKKLPVVHPGQSGGNGDEVADARDETARDGRHHTVVVEIAFALLHLLLREQAEAAEAAVGEAVDERAAQIVAGQVVDGGPTVGSDRRKDDDPPGVEVLARMSEIGRRRDDQLRGYGDDGTLKQHQKPNPRVVEMLDDKLKKAKIVHDWALGG